jgi:hypothetical protein
MFSTTVVLNVCQARNDSGSLTPSFTGLVTPRDSLDRELQDEDRVITRDDVSEAIHWVVSQIG